MHRVSKYGAASAQKNWRENSLNTKRLHRFFCFFLLSLFVCRESETKNEPFYHFRGSFFFRMSVSNGHRPSQLNLNPLHFQPLKDFLPLIFLPLKHRIRRNIWISKWTARGSVSRSKSLRLLCLPAFILFICARGSPTRNQAASPY